MTTICTYIDNIYMYIRCVCLYVYILCIYMMYTISITRRAAKPARNPKISTDLASSNRDNNNNVYMIIMIDCYHIIGKLYTKNTHVT